MDNDVLKVGKYYELKHKLGSGAFGEIYLAHNTKDDQDYAVKLEERRCKYPQLSYEYKLYRYLHAKGKQNEIGIPRVYYYNTEGQYNVMIMDLLGKSLEDLLQKCKGKFSVKTVLMLAPQMIKLVRTIHSRNFLHRDIKPDNFSMGVKKYKNYVYIFDFGLAKRYLQRDGKHIPYKEGKDLTGTARYASINTHMGVEQGRRDDLESLGYVLMYFLRGRLPWQSLPAKTKKQKYKKIMEKKQETHLDVLCKGFPDEFAKYINYCRTLKFEDKPDYKQCVRLFESAFKQRDYDLDYQYDWGKLKKSSKSVKKRSTKTEQQIKKEVKKHQDRQNHDNKRSKNQKESKKQSTQKQKRKSQNKKSTNKARNKHEGEGYTLQNLIDFNKTNNKNRAGPKIVNVKK